MYSSGKVAAKGFARAFTALSHAQFFPPLTRILRSHPGSALPSFHSVAASPFIAPVLLHPTNGFPAVSRASAASAAVVGAFLSADEVPLTAACGIAKHSSPREAPLVEAARQEAAGLLGQAGEDAFFAAANGLAWGVADGVGGWASHPGADSARYSRTLMTYALQRAAEASSTAATPSSSPRPPPSPLSILSSAYTSTLQHGIIGSTTACIITYDPHEQQIAYANLGDSGLLVVRSPSAPSSSSPVPPSAFQKSRERQHSWNCPLQLGTGSGDRPSDAEVDRIDVEDGDVMVVGTDGLFDNLSLEEIARICSDDAANADSAVSAPFPPSPASPASAASVDALARRLCEAAHAASRDPVRDTPFSRNCRQHGKHHKGGKVDDISVVVVRFRAKRRRKDEHMKSRL